MFFELINQRPNKSHYTLHITITSHKCDSLLISILISQPRKQSSWNVLYSMCAVHRKKSSQCHKYKLVQSSRDLTFTTTNVKIIPYEQFAVKFINACCWAAYLLSDLADCALNEVGDMFVRWLMVWRKYNLA